MHYILLFLTVLLIGCGNSAQPTAKMQSYPRRGDILDRNGICLVTSKPSYILWTIPCEHDAVGFDTMQLAQVFGVNKERLAERFKAALKTPETPSLIFSQIDENIKNSIVKFNIKGLYFTDSPGRLYPDSIAVHTLGYVGNMSKDYAREHGIIYDENRMVGLKGLEMIYNSVLMGDIESAKAGATLTTTLDARLQHYAESLMEDKIGAAVAIAPATGEILMSVSAPFFNPSLLVGRKSGNNYMNLLQDKKHPYINRTISIYYHLPDTLISMMLPNPQECDILHAINGQKIDNSRFEPIDKVAADDDGFYMTPIGLAQSAAVLANGGVCKTPRLVKSIEGAPEIDFSKNDVKYDLPAGVQKRGLIASTNKQGYSITISWNENIAISVVVEDDEDVAAIVKQIESFYLS